MIRRWFAKRRLARLVTARRNSPELVAWRKHRAAAQLGLLRKSVRS